MHVLILEGEGGAILMKAYHFMKTGNKKLINSFLSSILDCSTNCASKLEKLKTKY
jgi:hypothetical protein